MNSFPQAPYAEDQEYAKTILTFHVLDRGFESGSIAGSIIGAGRYFLLKRKIYGLPFWPVVTNATGIGAVIGTGLSGLGLIGRMWGREEIEWQDRSWRLLGNSGQNEVTNWSTVGQSIGAISYIVRRPAGIGGLSQPFSAQLFLGRIGLGSMAGIAGYMAWRYGVKKGKFEE